MTQRIISGSRKGKKLHSISGMRIRPTSDRVRESVFNILAILSQDTVVLDLFAGTGALGIEAISRGAKSVVFIDSYKNALSVIKKNIHACAFEKQSKVIKWDILKNLNCIETAKPFVNLVFMDPPYETNSIETALSNLYKSNALANNASIIIEHSTKEPIPRDIFEYEVTDQRE